MKSWFPEKGERWVFQIEVSATREMGERRFVRYRPLYLQQQGAQRELEEKVFLVLFSPADEPSRGIVPGSHWVLPVDVVEVDHVGMTVDYLHTRHNIAGDLKQMNLHTFRATFRRQRGKAPSAPGAIEEWAKGRKEWQLSQKIPASGDKYLLDVMILEVIDTEIKKYIKYRQLNQQAEAAPRVLEESVFIGAFEPLHGAVQEAKAGDEWFMMVEVTDFDPEELTVWYRVVSTTGERRGNVRHLSDHIFMATFRSAK